MKKFFRILVFMLALLPFAIVTQSLTPPLPTTTQVKIWSIPECYAVRICTFGPLWSNPSTQQLDIQDVEDPYDPQNVSMELAYYDTSNPPTYVSVYTKATSQGSWVYRGNINNNDQNVTTYSSNNLLYWFEFDFDDLWAPPPCP